ncbi:MAG TPA: hypothetical protein VLE22_16600 [Bryobacteraceae bacterium]|nr:hypothetical protein [Bryobacteraceae bacterium]
MSAPNTDHETGHWRNEGYPWTIEYPRALMDRIRSAALDGFFRIPRGGVEVGGVLFGNRNGKLIRIQAFRPLECEYATGPSFVLSEKDRRNLKELLAGAGSDPELAGMVALGWYHTRTRSEVFLSEADIEIYDQFFPEPWQVSLIVRPERIKPTRAGFFLRENNGSMRGESSPQEFILEPSVRQARPSAAAVEDDGRATVPEEESDLPALHRPESRQWPDWLIFTAALLLFLAGAGLLSSSWWPKSAAPLSLRLIDHSGQLEVQWAQSADEARDAESGSLEIIDGEKRTRLELTGGQLRLGSLTYERRSGTVYVTLRVRRAGKDASEAYAQFVGETMEEAPPWPKNLAPSVPE